VKEKDFFQIRGDALVVLKGAAAAGCLAEGDYDGEGEGLKSGEESLESKGILGLSSQKMSNH